MFFLSWNTAIVGTAFFAAGLGFWEISKYLSRHIKARPLQIMVAWPCAALAAILVGLAMVVMGFNMFGPIATAVSDLFN